MIDSKNIRDLTYAVRTTLLISGCFATLTLLVYLVFRGWNEYSAWGAFGDYVGGLLNPIFAFANVIVLVVISYKLAEIDCKCP